LFVPVLVTCLPLLLTDFEALFLPLLKMQEIADSINTYRRWIALAVLFVLLTWESLYPFFGFFLRKTRQRMVHGATNVAMAVINTLLIVLFFVTAWTWASTLATDKGWGLLNSFDAPIWLDALIAILLFDIFTYWFHRLSHRVPFLWRFHRVHHSDPQMDVTTANRFHFGEIIISSLLRVGAILAIGAEIWQLALYEAIMFPVVQFHHANIVLPPRLDGFLRLFIATPAMHKVHHSRLQPETDSNYTSLLSVWDRIFRSFRTSKDLHAIELGLQGYDSNAKQNLIGLLKTPKD